MKTNDFITGAAGMLAVIITLDVVYKLGKVKGYNEGFKKQKEQNDIYNNGYADGCKSCSKNLVD